MSSLRQPSPALSWFNTLLALHPVPGYEMIKTISHSKTLLLATVSTLLLLTLSKQTHSINSKETCAEKPAGIACWQELDNRPGCYLWNPELNTNATVTWTEACDNGLAQGHGEIKWTSGINRKNITVNTGTLHQGKMHGRWSITDTYGNKAEGQLNNGIPQGEWIFHTTTGTELKGSYINGKEHGQWTLRLANGTVGNGPIIKGKLEGQWILRFRSATAEGNYINNKIHGQWSVRYSSSDKVFTIAFNNGVLVKESLFTVENLKSLRTLYSTINHLTLFSTLSELSSLFVP